MKNIINSPMQRNIIKCTEVSFILNKNSLLASLLSTIQSVYHPGPWELHDPSQKASKRYPISHPSGPMIN